MNIETRKIIGKVVLETLENREMMSAVTLTKGVLVVQGNSNSANQLTIHSKANKVWAVTNQGASPKFAVSSVRQIRVIGGEKADKVTVANTLKTPVYVQTGAGNDTITTGAGKDSVYAGNGNDVISSGARRDYIESGNGNDTVNAGGGNDRVYAGNGNDMVYDGRGKDVINTANGNDTVVSGAGADTIRLGAGKNMATDVSSLDKVSATGSKTVKNVAGKSVSSTPTEATPAPVSDDSNSTSDDSAPTPDPIVTPDPTPGSDAPYGVITVMESSFAVDHAVQVNGLTSNLKAGTVLTSTFQWDFGDKGSKYNQLVGWNAAHLYTKAGTYTITLTITNEDGKTSVTTKDITVAASDRKVIYVSNSGSDSSTGLSPQSAVATFSHAMGLAGSNTEVLFNRGDKFNVTKGATISGTNVVIGTYGSGSSPILNWTGAKNYSAFFTTTKSAKDVTFSGITFDSKFTQNNEKTGMPDCIDAGGKNISVFGVTFLNIGYGLNANQKPTGVLMQGCDAPLITGIRSYLAYAQGSDQVYIGNTVANSTREHCIRVDGTDRVLIAYNNLTNLDRRGKGDNGDIAKQTITVHHGSYAFVYGNVTHGGRVEIGPLGEADGLKPENIVHRLNYVKIENNDFTFDANDRVEIDHGTSHVMVDQNKISVTSGAGVAVQAAGKYTEWTGYGDRHVEDATITADNVITGASKKVTVGRGAVAVQVLTSAASLPWELKNAA